MAVKPRIVTRKPFKNADILPDDIHPVLKRIYLSRGIADKSQIENSLKHLLSFENLKDIDKAVVLLAEHVQQDKNILIVGDYDADGATSCALAKRALHAMGAKNITYLVPNRFEYGYGLTPEIVEVAKTQKPDLIVTVDNGIASVDGVRTARESGIRVLITDHHLPGDMLPHADAIVNPNQPGDLFESKNLAGVGVIFYLMLALRACLREQGWFVSRNIKEPNLAEFLDLVALGTIADVVKLDHNNRILVAQGLARIRAGQACPGIMALLNVAGRDYTRVTSMDMGFFLGPRLNAAGRLDDMSIGIECLLADDETQAYERARVLDSFNRERRQIEQKMRMQADIQLEKLKLNAGKSDMPSAICLYDNDFHEGVIGILAGRIKEQTHRPTIVFARTNTGILRGSARSIPGLHIRDALDRLATSHPDLLSKFGGHAMAAGLSIEYQDLEEFITAFTSVVDELLDEDALQQVIHSDGELQTDDVCLELAELLRIAGPWGQGFPEPTFEGQFEILQRRIVGEHHLKMLLKKSEKTVDAIAFRTDDKDWPEEINRVKLVYRLDVNEFNGRKNVQFIVEYVEPMSSQNNN